MKAPCLLVCLLAVAPARANEASQEAFDAFRGLQGHWTIASGTHVLPFKMTYDLASKGSVVTEQFGKELSVFSRDGGALLMTHYCNAGNQPHLQLKMPVSAGTFDFVMTSITGLDHSGDAHVQEMIYHVVNARTVTLRIIWSGAGTAAFEEYVLTKDALQ